MSSETKTVYRDIDLNLALAEPKDAGHCGQCGMATVHPREFHPFEACLLFRALSDGRKVREHLEILLEYRSRLPAPVSEEALDAA